MPEDVHPFWWYDCTKVGTVPVVRLPNLEPVLEPVMVRGKGWPKGSKGNGKNDGVTDMF